MQKLVRNYSYFIIIVSLLIFTSCAYYNTFYNAKQYYKEGKKGYNKSSEESNRNQLDSELQTAFSNAISKSQKVRTNYPDSKWADNALYILAMSNYYLENYKSAKKYFEEFISEYPESTLMNKVKVWYGKTQWELGEIGAALRQWKNIENQINNKELLGELYYLIGNSFYSKNNQDSALTYYKEVQKIKNSKYGVESLFRIVDIYMSQKRYDLALKNLNILSDMVLSLKNTNREQIQRIDIYRKQGKYSKAKNIINKRLNNEARKDIWGELELQLALIYKAQDDIDKAISRLNNITQEYQNTKASAKAFYHLGEIHLIFRKDYEKASEYYGMVSKEASDQELINKATDKKRMVDNYRQMNKRYKELLTKINKIEKTNSSDLNTNSDSDTANVDSDTSNIETTKLDTLSLYEKYYKLQYQIGETLYFEMNKKDTAKTIYRKLSKNHKYNPYISKSLYALYYINKLEGKSKRAKRHKEELIAEFPDSPYIDYIEEGEVILSQNLKEARDLYKNAEKYFDTSPDTSISILTKIVSNYPDSKYGKKSILSLGWLYNNKLYKPDSALKWYKTYEKNFPDGDHSEYVQSRVNILTSSMRLGKEDEDTDTTALNNNGKNSADSSKDIQPDLEKGSPQKNRKIDKRLIDSLKKDTIKR